MDLKMIGEELRRLSALVDGWHASHEITTLERDLVLEKLRTLYEAVRFDEVQPESERVQQLDNIPEAIAVSINLDEAFSIVPPVSDEPVPVEEMSVEAAPIEELSVEEMSVEEAPIEELSVEEMSVETAPIEELSVEEMPVEAAPIEELAADQSIITEPITEEKTPAESCSKPVSASLFGSEEEGLQHRHRQRVIMSLYDPEPPTFVAPQKSVEQPIDPLKPVAESAPGDEPSGVDFAEQAASEADGPVADFAEQAAPEQTIAENDDVFEEVTLSSGVVLGEVINHDRTTLSDTITPQRDMASELCRREPITDFRRVIGINDKFLMIHDLFGGEGREYELAIDALNDFKELDDCMIFIAENYAWNPNSDGAKLLMELLERKFA